MSIYVVGSTKNKFRRLDNLREKFFVDQPHKGDNIDRFNPFCCELTGLYYMWKHGNDEIVGLEHYRRYLSVKGNAPIGEDEIRKRLQTADVLCTTVSYGYSPIKTYFVKNGKLEPLLRYMTFLEVMEGRRYADHCRNYMNGNVHVLGNIFIAKRSFLDEYAPYLFRTLGCFYRAEKAYRRPLQPRILGYLSEFLFGAYLGWHKCKLDRIGFCWN